MLSPSDDLPWHQIPAPFAVADSGDHRWFDRYWFVAFDPTGRLAFATGSGVYKNMDVLDGFAAAVVGDTQHNVRVSRRLRPDLATIGAGPLRYEIVEGMRRFHLGLAPNEHGLECELDWRATTDPHLEAHHFRRVDGVVLEDYERFFQFGTVTGHVTVAGTRFEAGDGWFGFRDRSFGIRPGVGGPAPQPAERGSSRARAFMLGAAFALGDETGVFQVQRDARGSLLYLDGHLARPHDPSPRRIVDAVTDVEASGEGVLAAAHVELRDERGASKVLELSPLCAPFVHQGFGYFDGFRDRLGLGVRRGELLVEGERYDLSVPGRVVDESGARDFAPGSAIREGAFRVRADGRAGVADTFFHARPSSPRPR